MQISKTKAVPLAPVRHRAILLLTAFAAYAITVPSASACECAASLGAAAEFAQSDVVFIGKALTNIQVREGEGQARLTVQRIFKGRPDRMTVVFTGGPGSCGVKFERDVDYLVYARIETKRASRIWTTICNRTDSLARASVDVPTLEQLQK